jgi:PAS domain S-box-containing protein
MPPTAEGQGRWTPKDRGRDAELESLRLERARLREELQAVRKRFRRFADSSRRFVTSMRSRMSELRRLELQYLVSAALEDPTHPDGDAERALEIIAQELGSSLGVLWEMDGATLRCAGTWHPADDASPEGLMRACRATSFPPERAGETRAGLPARVRREGTPVWVSGLDWVGDPRAGEVPEDVQGVLAFPVANSRGLLLVMEFFGLGVERPDDGFVRTFRILGNQIAQVLERRQAEEALRESEARSLDLLESITSVFLAVDEDWRLTYANRRAEHLLGDRSRHEVTGHDLWKLFPGLRGSPFEETYRRAARERSYSTVTAYYPDHKRWYESHAYPTPGGIAIYVGDVTERKQAERVLQASAERARFLARFTDETRAVSRPADIVGVAIRLIGEQLGASRVIYAEVEPDNEHFVIHSDFTAGVPSMAGRYRLADFSPELVSRVRTGSSIVVTDTEVDTLAPGERAAYATVSVRAHLDAPLVKAGRFVAFLGVHQSEPRAWTEEEMALVEEVAERTRSTLERARAEEALRESEAFVSAVNDTVSVGTAIVDLRGDPRIVYCNPAAERIMDRTAETLRNMRGQDLLDMVHPEDRGGFSHFFERCRRAETGDPVRYEYRVRRPDGEYLWVETHGVAFERGASGATAQFLFVFEDITERKRAETEREALRREAETGRRRLEAVLQQMPGGVFIADHSGKVSLANRGAERIFGTEVSTIWACGASSLSYPEGGELSTEEYPLVRALQGEAVSGLEHYVVRPSGARRVVSVNAAPVRDEDGRIVAAVKVVDDITDRKRIEEALTENEEWLRLAERAARSGMWEWDLNTGEIRWSDEHRTLFGFGAEVPITRKLWWDSVHPDDVQKIEAAGRRCAERGEQWPEIEYRITRADGERRWIEARGRTIFDSRNRPARILGTSLDVTDRRRAERERERLKALEVVAQAQAAERQAISRELHDRVAHDMAVAHQNLQLFGAIETTDAERAASKLQAAEESVKAALDATRNLSSELRHSEADEGLGKALQEFAAAAARTENGTARRVRTSVCVRGDESLLPEHIRGQAYLIVREAVRNALKHSGCSKVAVELEISPTGFTGSVTDDGAGFVTGDQEAPPKGVGLKSMRERTELLGGTFHLQTAPGRGTRVEVSLHIDELYDER